MQESIPGDPHPGNIPYLPGHPTPTLRPNSQMHSGLPMPPRLSVPPGLPIPPGVLMLPRPPGQAGNQIPPCPPLLPRLQVPPQLHRPHSDPFSPPGYPDLTRHPVPFPPTVSPGFRVPLAPKGPSIQSGFPVSTSPRDPPRKPGPGDAPSQMQLPASPHLPANPNPPQRQRKPRITYKPWQKALLEAAFEKNKYPSYEETLALAKELEVQDIQRIQVWFKNHRAKLSRQQHFQTHSEAPPPLSGCAGCSVPTKPGARAVPYSPRGSAPASAPEGADAVCPGLCGISCVSQGSSNLGQRRKGNGSSGQKIILNGHVSVAAEGRPIPAAAVVVSGPSARAPRPVPEATSHGTAAADPGTGPASHTAPTPCYAQIPDPAADANLRAAAGALRPAPDSATCPASSASLASDATPDEDAELGTSPDPDADLAACIFEFLDSAADADATSYSAVAGAPGSSLSPDSDADSDEDAEQLWHDLINISLPCSPRTPCRTLALR